MPPLGPILWIAGAVIYAVMSAFTFVLFMVDKDRAIRHDYRIPEKVLLWASLLGGWPGGLIAMKVCHHKTRKVQFLLLMLGTMAIHMFTFLGMWFFFQE